MISSDDMRFKTHFLFIFFNRGRKGNCLEATIRSKEKVSPTSMPSGQEVWEKEKIHHLRKLTRASVFLGKSQISCIE